jgi:hypothetical protein
VLAWLENNWSAVVVNVVTTLATLGVLYRVFGEKLIGHFFDRRLEAFKNAQTRDLELLKHEHNQQIEQLRSEIGHLADRGKHSNEREYTALSAIWEKFVDLYYATSQCVIAFVQYPDFVRMSDDEIKEFLDTTDFSKDQKAAVLTSQDRGRSFSHITTRRYINEALVQFYEMNRSLHKLGIFIPRDLKQQFEAAGKMCSSVIAQRRTEHGENLRTGLKFDSEFLAHGEAALEGLKDAVRARLLPR